MEKEISSGTNLGIVLIALAAIIALGFGIFAIAKGTANEGVVQVQDNLSQVQQSVFNDYDQKIVTGTQVVSAYNNFSGKPYALLIATQAFIDHGTPKTNNIRAMDADGSDPIEVVNSDGDDNIPLVFINYNALLGGNEVYLDNGTYKARNGFALNAGEMTYNGVIANMSKSGTTEFIPASARFQANLIMDSSGTIMGMAFKQVGVGQ